MVLISTLNSGNQNFDTQDIHDRLHIHQLHTPLTEFQSEDAHLVIQGLSDRPKTLPPRFFYDDYGSQLFEQICQLPEYYLTRTETQIFQTCSDDIASLTGACELLELGSGSSTKTRLLLDAYDRAGLPLRYVPIDVSAGILQDSAQQLLHNYPTLKVFGIVGTYQQALQELMPSTLPSRMIAFIGSTLGNLPPVACDRFLGQIAAAMEVGDFFLLGIDLQKSKAVLEAAYNDSQGVTAAFNLNMLTHLNRKFKADFDVKQFEHVAFYNDEQHQIEMHLRSLTAQSVRIDDLNLDINFDAGETIHSEVSRKFNLTEMQTLLRSHDLKTVNVWTDPKQWFGMILAQRQSVLNAV